MYCVEKSWPTRLDFFLATLRTFCLCYENHKFDVFLRYVANLVSHYDCNTEISQNTWCEIKYRFDVCREKKWSSHWNLLTIKTLLPFLYFISKIAYSYQTVFQWHPFENPAFFLEHPVHLLHIAPLWARL